MARLKKAMRITAEFRSDSPLFAVERLISAIEHGALLGRMVRHGADKNRLMFYLALHNVHPVSVES